MMQITATGPRRIVLSYGVFDMFTSEHIARLQSMAQLGHELIIGCATDAYCAAMNIRPKMSYAKRRAALEKCRFVSHVFAQTDPLQHRTDIVNYNASLLAMDSRWTGQFDDLQDVARVHYLAPKSQFSHTFTAEAPKYASAS